MTTLAYMPLVAQDEAGNKLDGASVRIKNYATGLITGVVPCSNRDGSGSKGNPYTAADGGDAGCFLAAGFYQVEITKDGVTRTQYRACGTAAEYDVDIFLNANRASVRAATTAGITIATALNNGDSLDGLTLVTNDRVLVWKQTLPAQNGVYVVGASPARASDFDTYDDHAGAILAVSEGTANAGKLFFGAINAGGVLATTAINFVEIEGVPGADGAPASALIEASSTTSLAIATGSKAFTLAEADARGYGIGARLRASSDALPAVNYMEGVVTAYSHPTLTVLMDEVSGSGTHTDWTINIAGNVGSPGADGNDPGILLTWDDGNTDSNPGAGKISADDDDLSVATELYVSKTNRAGDDIEAFLLGLANSTNPTIKGQLTLTRSGGNAQAILNVTGVTDATGYVKVAVQDHSGATGFLDDDAISFQFAAAGDKGTDGVGAGDVLGPASATDGHIPQFDGATGKLLKDGLQLDTDGTLAANSDTRIASQKAVKTYADALIAANDAMVFKGVIDCSANPNYPAADRGHTYRVSVAGKIGGGSGVNVEAGDILLCLTDSTASGNQATVGSAWSIIQVNIDGAVTLTGTQTLTNKTLTSPVINSPTGIVKGDVGLGNVDNTSNATERAATATLTNKRVTPRVLATAGPGATPAINTDSYDFVDLTALATAITSMSSSLSGTPTNGQKLVIRFKDNGTARAITWGASFEAVGTAVPTTTVISKRLTVGFIYDTTTSKWGCVASVQEL